jgi:hypothetical protein
MKKRKQNRQSKPKQKRNKVYKGAAAQSAKDKEDKYQPSIDYLSNYNSTINTLSNQLNHFTTPLYQTGLTSAMAGIQDKLSAFSKFETMLPNFDKFSAVSQAFDLSRNVTRGFADLSTPAIVTNLASIVSKDYTPWYNETFVKGSLLSSSAFAALDIAKTNQALIDTMGLASLSAFSVQSTFAKATELSLFAEKSLSTFAWADIGNKIGLSDISKGLVSSSFLGLSNDYSDLIKSYGANPSSFLDISPSISKLIPVEYYTGANFLEVITTEEQVTTEEELIKNEIQYENEYSLNLYLPKINTSLLNMWKGAIETYNSNNSDKVRQFTVSIRELFGHLMHTLAPDDEIKKWTTDTTFFHEGRPTRKARLHYICRNISSKPFNKFVEKDIQATIEFIAIFQDGTHSIESGFTPAQLVALKSKAEATLKFLLEIEFSTNN